MQEISSSALADFAGLLGAENVFSDERSLDGYRQNVSGVRRMVGCVLRPGSKEDVQGVVRLANRHRVPLYPISRGCNWGLGSKLPVRDGCAILDLRRMNRILEINETHHYAVIEPGVTQGQLADELKARGVKAVLNVTGSGRGSSVLGNSLDRGVGYFSSRAAGLSGLEVALGNGEILRTGFGHYEASKTTHLYRYGIGPGLDGLFFQSNFGVVTQAGVALIPWAEEHESAIIKIRDPALLERLVDAVADLRKRDVVRMIVHIGNRLRTIGTLAPLVYRRLSAAEKEDAAAARDLAEQLLAKEGFGAWSAIAGYSGTDKIRAATRRAILDAVRGFAEVTFLSDRKIRAAKRMLDALRFLPGARRKRLILDAMEPIYGLSNGVPTDAAIPSVYWTAGMMPPDDLAADPDESRCGMLYSLPMIPLEGRLAVEAVKFVEDVFARHGFVSMTTLNAMDDRCLELVISIPFARDEEQRAAAAHACLDELQAGWISRGYVPYRMGVQEMNRVVGEGDVFWETARALKSVLDPNNIIAPGRYNLV